MMKVESRYVNAMRECVKAACLVACLASCSSEEPTAGPSPSGSEQEEALVVVSEMVSAEVIELRARVQGEVVARERVALVARASGTVEELRVEKGDRVEADSAIARIAQLSSGARARQARAEVDVAEAALGMSRVRMEQASRDVLHAREARASGALSDQAVEQAEAEEARANAEVEQAEARVTLARSTRDLVLAERRELDLRAPFEALVLERTVSEGAWVNTGETIVELADPSSWEVRTSLGQAQAATLGASTTSEWTLPETEHQFSLELVERDPVVDEQSRRVGLTFRGAGIEELPLGAWLEGEIVVRRLEGALHVSEHALSEESGQHYLWVIADSRVVRTPVDVELVQEGRAVVVGVQRGDSVVFRPPRRLREGALVEARPREEETPSTESRSAEAPVAGDAS